MEKVMESHGISKAQKSTSHASRGRYLIENALETETDV